MTQRFRSFASEPDIDEILDNVEFRNKSKFIKEAIRKYASDGAWSPPDPSQEAPGKVKAGQNTDPPTSLGGANPDPANSPASTAKPGSSTKSGTSSSEPEPTPSSGSQPEPDIPPLLRHLGRRRGGS